MRCRLVPIEADSGPYRRGFGWAEPDEGHAAELMRRVADDRELAGRIGERARRDIAADYSPERIGARMRAALEAIVSRRPKRQAAAMFWELLPKPTSRPYRLWWRLTWGRFGVLPAPFAWPAAVGRAFKELLGGGRAAG